MHRFDGKAVLILGGNAGIGAAATQLFANEGARLVITGRNEATLGDIAAQTGAHAIRADMGVPTESRDAITAATDHLGGIDVLFVNAGIGGFAMVPDVTEDFWDGIHDVNLKGAFFAMQAAAPLMRDGGSIVVTPALLGQSQPSTATSLMPRPRQACGLSPELSARSFYPAAFG